MTLVVRCSGKPLQDDSGKPLQDDSGKPLVGCVCFFTISAKRLCPISRNDMAQYHCSANHFFAALMAASTVLCWRAPPNLNALF